MSSRTRFIGRIRSQPLLAVASALALLALLIGAWLFWRWQTRVTDTTWQQVQLSGVLRVGLDASYPPFEYVNEETGEILGYDIDLARLIGEKFGTEIEIINSGFDGLYPALKMGRFDCVISAFPYDPLLTRDVAFTMSYFQAGLALVTRGNVTALTTTADLRDRTLAVEWGAQGDVKGRELQRQLQSMRLTPYATPDDALQAVAQGEADAALVDGVSAYEAVAQHPSLHIAQEGVTDELYVVIVPVDSPKLLAAINDALADFHEDGTLIRLREKWFGR